MTEIEQIKQKLDIVDVIGRYVDLKKSGRNYKGLCPFHGEKTPSFMVNRELQIFKCFGCNEAGDVFTFVEKMEGYDFKQTLTHLAGLAGIELKNQAGAGSSDNNKSLLYEINGMASKFYHYVLTKHSAGRQALDYLKQKRGLTEKTIEDWELGYAPDSWTSLLDFMKKQGYEEKDMLKAGVIAPDKFEKRYNDKFRGRIIFPLTGIDGKILGFGGRTISNREPKYLNTQETSIFHKENFLYGLNKSRMEIKNRGAVVVEGYMDVIGAYQAGITNVMATCGTALTMPHLKTVSRYTPDITFCFDSDSAGVNATFRAIEMCTTLDLNPKVAVLPDGVKDIDDLARTGRDNVISMINKAVPAFDFVINTIESRHDKTSPIGKKKIMEEVVYFLSKSPSPVIKEHYSQILAQRLYIDPSSVTAYMNDKSKDLKETAFATNINLSNTKSPAEYFLALLLTREVLDNYAKIIQNLTPDDFHQSQLSGIYTKLLESLDTKGSLSVKSFINGLADQDLVKARELSLWDIGDTADSPEKFESELAETARRIKKESLKRSMRELTVKIRDAEAWGDDKKTAELTEEFEILKKEVI